MPGYARLGYRLLGKSKKSVTGPDLIQGIFIFILRDKLFNIYTDADACPIKQELHRVNGTFKLKTTVVSKTYIRIPENSLIASVVVL